MTAATLLPRATVSKAGVGNYLFTGQTQIYCPTGADPGLLSAAYSFSGQLARIFQRHTPVVLHRSVPQDSIYIGNKAPFAFFAMENKTKRRAKSAMDAEQYVLSVNEQGAVVRAASSSGFLYAMQTLIQLVTLDRQNQPVIAGGFFEDGPLYPYRGLMLDPARHFIEPEFIKRTIEAMSLCKLNTLHLHLTDDQSICVESKVYPELTAYSSRGRFYSQEQMKELIDYALVRGVTVVPEFDMPAHADALMHALPFLHCLGKRLDLRDKRYGNNNTALCVSKASTFEFIEGFLAEMAALFPAPVVHIGSDEVGGAGGEEDKTGPWDMCPDCQALVRQHGWPPERVYRELQCQFLLQVQQILHKLGKKLMGWEEITWAKDLSREGLVQHWCWPADQLVKILQQGHTVVLSQLMESRMYLDYSHSDLSIERLYHDRLLPANLTTEEIARVYGVEACMWCYPQKDLDFLLWPRLLVTAEFGWSGDEKKNLTEFLHRSEKMVDLLRQLCAVDVGPIYPPYVNRSSIRPPGTF